jgi:aldehyde:ferredoxin oxidoreductase
MANGLWNKALRVDLSQGQLYTEAIPQSLSKKLIGGAGLGAYYLKKEVPASCKPLDPQNLIMFTSGPFQSSKLPGSAKFSIVTRSPLTNGFLDTAAGASFGHNLKKSGYDLLIISGASPQPVYLYVHDGIGTLLAADDLWGKDTIETTALLKAKHPKASVSAIGPAGEQQTAFACIYVDSFSAAGRGGAGAVMGSKRLKAVVVEGSAAPEVANPELLAELEKTYRKRISEAAAGLREGGTMGGFLPGAASGNLPVKNWSVDGWEDQAQGLGLPAYNALLKPKLHPCAYCPVACHRSADVDLPSGGHYQGPAPEYETVALLGSSCLIDNMEQVVMLNDFCNRQGMDTISAGSCAAFAMEALEKGHTRTHVPTYPFGWGNSEGLKTFLQEMVDKSGFGGLFSSGIREAQKAFEPVSDDYACHVKGMDIPGHDPRVYYNLGLSYATGNRGACHMRAYSQIATMGALLPEVGVHTAPAPDTLDDAGRVVKIYQDFTAYYNSCVLCQFMIWGGFGLKDMVDCTNAITGWDLSIEETIESGDRVFTLQRMVNNTYGIGASDDKLPKRFFEASQVGGRSGKAPLGLYEEMKKLYSARQWDADGSPTPQKIQALGLDTMLAD